MHYVKNHKAVTEKQREISKVWGGVWSIVTVVLAIRSPGPKQTLLART